MKIEKKSSFEERLEAEMEKLVKRKITQFSREDYAAWGRLGGQKKKRFAHLDARKKPQCEKRFQPGAMEKLQMIERMQALLPSVKEGEKQPEPKWCWFQNAAEDQFESKLDGSRLRRIWREKATLLEWRKEFVNKGVKLSSRSYKRKGAKAGGGGPKVLLEEKAKLKRKVELEEQHYGHELEPCDLVDLWREVLAEDILLLKRKQQNHTILSHEEKDLKLKEEKLKVMSRSKYKWQNERDIMQWLKRKARTVQRKTALSAKEEQRRLRLTWQDFDEALDVACFRYEALQKKVDAPDEFMQNIEDLQIEFEDEVGIWLGLKGEKVAMDEDRHREAVKRQRIGTAAKESQDDAASTLLEEGQAGGVVQVRGTMAKGADKRRITVMPRMVLKNVVQGRSEEKRRMPAGRMERMVVVVPGEHCCLDFVEFDAKDRAVWNRDWEYEYNGEQHQYMKGELCGARMKAYVLLKKQYPELFKNLLVFQQPAAVRDSVIVGWCLRDLCSDKKHGTVQQHDLVGCQSAVSTKKLRQHLQCLQAIIAADMTAVCQLTDIICAKKAKDIAVSMAAEIKKWLKRKAAHLEQNVKYTVGPYEMMLLCSKIYEGCLTNVFSIMEGSLRKVLENRLKALRNEFEKML